MSEMLSISEVAAATGLSRDTLRWYEREGLIPNIHRSSAGRRTYSEEDVRLLHLIVTLRRTGLPVRDTADFVTLVNEGAASHGRRMALLTEHRRQVEKKLEQIKVDLGAIDAKIDHYSTLIEQGKDCLGEPITDPEIMARQRSLT